MWCGIHRGTRTACPRPPSSNSASMTGERLRWRADSKSTMREAAMNAIKGTYRDGHVVLEAPTDWPDGTSVLVEPIPKAATTHHRAEDEPPDAEAIARQLALMDQIEPLLMTPEEEAHWQAARRSQ